jgi:hypothetical protein
MSAEDLLYVRENDKRLERMSVCRLPSHYRRGEGSFMWGGEEVEKAFPAHLFESVRPGLVFGGPQGTQILVFAQVKHGVQRDVVLALPAIREGLVGPHPWLSLA